MDMYLIIEYKSSYFYILLISMNKLVTDIVKKRLIIFNIFLIIIHLFQAV